MNKDNTTKFHTLLDNLSTTSMEILVRSSEENELLFDTEKMEIIKKELENRKKNPDGKKKVVIYFNDGKLIFRGYKYETDKGFINMYKEENPVKITRQYYPLKDNTIDIIYEGKKIEK